MERKLIQKMIQQSLLQYHRVDLIEEKEDYTSLYNEIMKRYTNHEGEIFEIIEDVVYEYITT